MAAENPSPDPLYTPRSLVARIKAEAGGATPVGEKVIRALLASGELPAAPLGRGLLIRWSDWTALVERRARERRPGPARPTRRDRIERAIHDRLDRERGE